MDEEKKVFDISSIMRDTNNIKFNHDGFDYEFERLILEDEVNYDYLYYIKDDNTQTLSYKGAYEQILKLCKLVNCPYTSDVIGKLIGTHKEWSELTIDERFKFFKNCKSEYLTELIKKYKENSDINNIQEELKN